MSTGDLFAGGRTPQCGGLVAAHEEGVELREDKLLLRGACIVHSFVGLLGSASIAQALAGLSLA